LWFFNVCQLQGFFYEYFLVKSHLREVPYIRWDIYYFSERAQCRLSKKVQTFNKFLLWNPWLLKNGVTAYLIPVKMPISPLRVYGF
jgi:hypothetical protein